MSFSSSGSVTVLTIVSTGLADSSLPAWQGAKHPTLMLASPPGGCWSRPRAGMDRSSLRWVKLCLRKPTSHPKWESGDKNRSFCNSVPVLVQQGGASSAAFSFKQIKPISVFSYVFIHFIFFLWSVCKILLCVVFGPPGSSVLSQEVKCPRARQWPGWLAQVMHPMASMAQRNTIASSPSLFPHVQGQVSPKGYSMSEIIVSSSSAPARNDQRFHLKDWNLITIKIPQRSAGAINPCLFYSGGW